MLETDQMLWERELAEHMRRYGTDLLDLPPVASPPLSPPPPAPSPPSRARKWLVRLLVWTPVAMVGGTVGWSLGWYVL